MGLTKEQWEVICAILPEDPVRCDRRGRPWSDPRHVLNRVQCPAEGGMRTGGSWQDMPDRYGADQSVHRRLQNWVSAGVMETVMLAISQDRNERGGLDLQEGFIDGIPRSAG